MLDILKDEKWVNVMTRIVDLGCAECKFLKRLLDLPRAREIVGVDFDHDLLEESKEKCEPLFINYLEPRKTTSVELYTLCGSVANFDDRLGNVSSVSIVACRIIFVINILLFHCLRLMQ